MKARVFGDVESCFGSDGIAGDIHIYSTVLKICFGHFMDDGIAGSQVLFGEPNLGKH